MLKSPLREQFRQERSDISAEKRLAAAEAAAHLLFQDRLFEQSQHIACYVPFRDEFDTKPLIHKIWYAGKYCYLPVLTQDKTLVFAQYEKGDELAENRYGILEPLPNTQQMAANELDLVMMPLMAFDSSGHRLGTGGGYYDKTFAFLHEHEGKKPFMLGLGYAFQQAIKLPVEAWDVDMDGMLTERKLWRFEG